MNDDQEQQVQREQAEQQVQREQAEQQVLQDQAEQQVLQAAGDLVAAFAEERLDDYFAAFAADATFVFHTTDRRIESVAEYRRVRARWAADDDFRVLKCLSSDHRVQLWEDTAVFTHTVATDVSTRAGTATLHERETIVFRRTADGRWLAVHEHLSPAAPCPPGPTERPGPLG
ncbi:nuclear transport factor 2 family protein [Streptomyces sp900105755]|uniref:Nuclear transport factor 2 family protein n=1 Tax=Streptomyces sp. 900105755 TaxID=3154389 RepID=A0ABV1TCK1_9ACTN